LAEVDAHLSGTDSGTALCAACHSPLPPL